MSPDRVTRLGAANVVRVPRLMRVAKAAPNTVALYQDAATGQLMAVDDAGDRTSLDNAALTQRFTLRGTL